ncbi:hypothetical protein ElyMa_003724200 [Elysia marginata]|uniref:Uncharacterized protein n=1 Tax=Elysia marginata TaxID=1093978 RepID=A0AAV4F554_9GAST|nr:hypothetical protein ElyMa_003724200 [Elysia marginata]
MDSRVTWPKLIDVDTRLSTALEVPSVGKASYTFQRLTLAISEYQAENSEISLAVVLVAVVVVVVVAAAAAAVVVVVVVVVVTAAAAAVRFKMATAKVIMYLEFCSVLPVLLKMNCTAEEPNPLGIITCYLSGDKCGRTIMHLKHSKPLK